MRPDLQLRPGLHREVVKFEQNLRALPAGKVRLAVTIERYPGKKMHFAVVNLALPGRRFRATEIAEDPVQAFSKSLRAIQKDLSAVLPQNP